MCFFFFKPKPHTKEITMSDIADAVQQTLTAVQATQAAVTSVATNLAALTTAVEALSAPAPATVDFTPVLDAIAAVSAQLSPTPAAPQPPSDTQTA